MLWWWIASILSSMAIGACWGCLGMIANQWYAVLSSHEVRAGKVLGARRFGEDLAFFRTKEGKLACVNSLCAHRKASLAKGWVEHDHIKCPFHGIEYDATGKCVYVPSEGRASSLDYERLSLTSYPVREVGGVVFVWYGSGEPDGEPDVFDVMVDPSYTYDHTSDSWGVHYSRVIENQLDVSHLAFVHHNTIGRGNKTLCHGPKVVWLDDHTLQTSANNETDQGQSPRPSEECDIRGTNLTFKFPNLWLNHVTDKIMILAFFIPVDDEHSIIALRFYNKITGVRAIDKCIAWLGSRANIVVERQDKRIVETQLPKKTGLAIGENLVAADLPIIEYRTKRAALQARGLPNEQAEELGAGSEGHDARAGAPGVREAGSNRQVPPAFDPKALYKLSYGLYVCTTVADGKANGCIINTAIQVASNPQRLSIAINKENYTCELVRKSGVLNISVLSTSAPFALFQRFGFASGRDTDKFADYPPTCWQTAGNGAPYITEETNAYLSLEVTEERDLGSHMLFICKPTFMAVLSDAPSCTYTDYQDNIKPKPKAVGTTPEGRVVWRCIVCGFEWVGDELPDDYLCPVCKHPKADFERIVL